MPSDTTETEVEHLRRLLAEVTAERDSLAAELVEVGREVDSLDYGVAHPGWCGCNTRNYAECDCAMQRAATMYQARKPDDEGTHG